uniref:Glia maturation factor beta n=1 Tax=Labrus bergylta TaxID=56723 RepID=A0A3Q3FBY9_9LABR
MSESLVVCDVDEELIKKLKAFRFRKETNNAAIIMKIDKERQLVVLDEEHEDISPDDLKEELPERQPRFIVYSYKYQHDDGRVSYPLCFIFSSPAGEIPVNTLRLFLHRGAVSGRTAFLLDQAERFVTARVCVCVCVGCKMELQMMYAGSRQVLVKAAQLSKVSEAFVIFLVLFGTHRVLQSLFQI